MAKSRTTTGGGKKKKAAPKKGKIFTAADGKKYRDLGGGRSQGVSMKKPKMKKVKAAPAYNSKKRKQTKRKTGGYTKR